MTDDIVTRLLNACDSNNCWCPMIDKRCIYAEAADEIERLREWKAVADMFGECFRMDEFGQFPTSNDGDVLEAVKAWERLQTKDARHDR